MTGGPARRWPFTEQDEAALRAAYDALTRVGNATMSRRNGRDTGYWDPLLDEAHRRLGLVLLMGRLDCAEPERAADAAGVDEVRLARFRASLPVLREVVEAVDAAYPGHGVDGPCGGLDSCPACQDLWRRLNGEPHGGAGQGAGREVS